MTDNGDTRSDSRVRLHTALRESEQQFRALFETASVGMGQADPQTGRFLRVNKKFCAITGYSEEELLKLRVPDITQPEDRQHDWELFQSVVRGEAPDYRVEKRYLRKDGAVVWVSVNVTVIRGAAGQPVRTLGVIEDITQRKQAEESLRESEERYRAVLEDQTELISRYRQDGMLTFVNEVYCRFFGKTREELVGSKWHPQAVVEDLALIEEKLHTLSLSNPVVVIENRVHSGSGEVRWMQFVNRGFFDADGRLVETQAVGRDISERKWAEEALLHSQSELKAIYESAPTMMCVLNASRQVTHANRAFAEFVGRPVEELKLERACGVIGCLRALDDPRGCGHGPHCETCAVRLAMVDALATGRSHHAIEYRTVALCRGKLRNSVFLASVAPIQISGHTDLLLCLEDITGREQAVEALRESEERLRLTTTSSNTGLWDWDLRTNEVYYSSIWKQQIGYEDHEISNSFEEWRSRVHPDDLDHAFAKVKAFVQKPWPDFENEFRFRHKDGSYRWMLAKASLQMDADGKPCRMLGSQLDITERKKTEEKLRRTAEQLQALSRALVDAQETERRRIAQELHDEIGQSLTLLKLSLDMTANRPQKTEHEHWQEASRRVGELLKTVRDLSLDLRPSMLDDLGLLPAVLWLGRRFTERAQLQVRVEHRDVEGRRFAPEVEIAVYRIVQEALTNVARHAEATQATVRLLANAGTLQVEIEDRGRGFNAAAALAASRSIGLSGMRERARTLGGDFSIESAPGNGTRVMARLPLGKVTGE